MCADDAFKLEGEDSENVRGEIAGEKRDWRASSAKTA
jgi:hypothetical protein